MVDHRIPDHLGLIDKGARLVAPESDAAPFISLNDGLSELKSPLNAGTLSLVLGAGLSRSCGIPDWPTLVESLFNSYVSDNYATASNDTLRYLGTSPIVRIRILRRLYRVKEAFIGDLRRSLYADLTDPPISPALEQLARLLVEAFKQGRSPNLITYNFDDLLENAIALVDPTIPVHAVASHAQTTSQRVGITVFHPHGYIPRDGETPERSTLVFSEDEFHVLMSDNAHWANVVQLHAFQNSTCLFVGTSLTDPNVRRLLDCSRSKGPPQHLLVRTLPKSITDARWVCKLVGDEMASLGVRVLGLRTYDEIPILFEKLSILGSY